MLFNRNLNVLGNAEHARLEELPLERFNVEEIPLDGEIVELSLIHICGGDYYPQAHIERGDDREVHICLLPQTPFCHENEKCTG